MRETKRVKIMERMRKKVRERERRVMKGINDSYQKKARRREDQIKKMAFVAQNPLHLTIFRLFVSSRVSFDLRCREFLIFAAHGVNEAIELLTSLEKFRDLIESKKMKALEGEIREATLKLENVFDSHVSHQFLSQCETESINDRQDLLFSLNLQGIEEDIDGFIQMVMKMEKLLNPWLQQEDDDDGDGDGEEESDIFGSLSNKSKVDVLKTLFRSWLPEEESDSDDDDDGDGDEDILGLSEVDHVSRSWFINWFATKAASIFLGMKEDYIQDLEHLLPEQEEDDDYAVLFTIDRTSDFSRMVSEDRFKKINGDLMIWWMNKAAASIFVMEMEDYTQQLVNHLPGSESESGVKMVGSTDLFCEIRDELLQDYQVLKICSIEGMAGIGKTALAKKIMKDPLILSKFEFCIFVRMGPECKWEEALRAIVAQMPDGDKMLVEEDMDFGSVPKILRERKCLVVLDDYWKRGPNIFHKIALQSSSQSAILFTSRMGSSYKNFDTLLMESFYKVPFLNKEESWDLLREKIFGETKCPPQLEKAGQKIAENCEGLPLLILTVAGLLSQAEKTPEYWSKIASNKTNSIFVDAYEQVSDVVYPSYYYLPQHLKACFLYLGAFPQNDDIRVSRLISLWSADGFLGVPYILLQRHAYALLKELVVSNNVALGTQWSKRNLKTLSLHSVFWYLCKREARNEKFLHVLNSYTDANVQGIETQRRLSVYKNAILSIKDVRDSIASISAVDSLLCTGPYHQYEVPICLGKLRLLKVLDALTIRFYEFPVEVLKLVQLRYLGLTCNGNLPPSISNLWGLQCLILRQHLRIKSSVSQAYLPVEIWDLEDLEHLQISGRNLPDPPPDTFLSKLLILLDVGALTCTKRVLARIPNLEKLRVQIELMPVAAAEPLSFCDDISLLPSLKSIQFVVVNPELKFEICAPVALFGFFPCIRKLTLSGFGYPWEDIHRIASLSVLDDLKLKCYAFRGEMWEVKEGEFEMLRFLSIEDTDLVHWTGIFQNLKILSIKNCYRLVELPRLSSSPYLEKILVEDCNPSAVTCANNMKCSVSVDSSWLRDGKPSP